jgi:hypothetical protein
MANLTNIKNALQDGKGIKHNNRIISRIDYKSCTEEKVVVQFAKDWYMSLIKIEEIEIYNPHI